MTAANATERESDFTTVLELASQVRAEFKRQSLIRWNRVPMKFMNKRFETDTGTLVYDMSVPGYPAP